VHQKSGRTEEIERVRIAEELSSARAGELPVEQKIPVSMHEPQGNAGPRILSQSVGDGRVERVAEVVVSSPVLKQVAQDVERFRLARGSAEKPEEHAADVRPRVAQMQVGNEEDRHD
jgi:hypothetical protein